MTCIVAVKQDGEIVIGADSAGSNGHLINRRADSKIVTIEGDDAEVVCGYTTSFRMGQILRHHVKLPAKLKKDWIDWLVVDVIEAICKALATHGWEQKDKEGVQEGGTFILVAGGNLFTVHADFQVAQPDMNYVACGSGQEVALGALHALNSRGAHRHRPRPVRVQKD